LDVGCVDANAALGGTCLRIGCIPSKALLESSHRYHEVLHGLAEHGVKAEGVALDLGTMQKRKDRIVRGLTGGVAHLFEKNGVARYQGTARLAGEGKVVVRTDDGETEIAARNVLIATGSRPTVLDGVELDGDRIGTSEAALSWKEAPPRLVVIGSGYIGLELGSVWNRLGSDVTLLEVAPRILPGGDEELAKRARPLFEKQGMTFRLGCRVVGATAKKKTCEVWYAEGDEEKTLTCDRVLLAVGRSPFTEGLGLEDAGIATDEHGFIPVDERFRTKADGVYAIGDVIGKAMLAHKASHEGIACVEGIATGHGHVDYRSIPSIVYTSPEIASVGRTEDALKEEGVGYRKGVFPFRANGRARTLGDTDGFVKILADEATDRVLGVHILGPRAGDVIAEAAAAIAYGASSEDVALLCHAHPTLSEAVGEAALAVHGRTINL
jgi:dihydrolipoamide dehydrogenase